MSKILKITPDLMEEARAAFEKSITASKKNDGVFKAEFSITRERRAVLVYEPLAWQKMFLLLLKYDTEVGWYGTVSREQNDNRDIYTVHDILVYPQKVTGGTVDTDNKELTEWILALKPEQRRNLRMHGHSHVTLSPGPSFTDDADRKDKLDQLPDGSFFVFQIWNKRFENTVLIYDLARNLLYDDKDVDIVFQGGVSPSAFLGEIAPLVKPAYTGTYASKSTTVTPVKATAPAASKQPASAKQTGKKMVPAASFSKGASGGKNAAPAAEEDDEEDYGSYDGYRWSRGGYTSSDFSHWYDDDVSFHEL